MTERQRLPQRRFSFAIDWAAIEFLIGRKLGKFDIACPMCGPARHTASNKRREVLRVWRIDQHFATFHCVRCGERGFVRSGSASAVRPDPSALERARAEAAERENEGRAKRLAKAQALWRRRRKISGTLGEQYIREHRGIACALPGTLGFLPGKPEHAPALISAYGIPTEPEHGVLRIDDAAVRAVQLTLLTPDGSGKADTMPNKITIGLASGSPIVVAPMTDMMGLAICEGAEDALSIHAATGAGAWAAGGASFMPKLAAAVEMLATAYEYDASPDCITIFADSDEDGRKNSDALAAALAEASARLSKNGPLGHFEILQRLT
jgi:Toprim domain